MNAVFQEVMRQQAEGGDTARYSLDDVVNMVTSDKTGSKNKNTSAKAEDAGAGAGADTDTEGKPTGKYSEENPNKMVEWLALRAKVAFKDSGLKGVTVDYTLPKGVNGFYEKRGTGFKITLNGQLDDAVRGGRYYSAQQNISFIIGHEVGHYAQYGAEFQEGIISVYSEATETSDAEAQRKVQELFLRYYEAASNGTIKMKASDVTMDYAREEYASDCLGEMMVDYNLMRKMAAKVPQNVGQKIIKLVGDAAKAFRSTSKTLSKRGRITTEADLYAEAAGAMETMLRDAMKNAQWYQTFNGDEATDGEARYKFSVNKEAQADITRQFAEDVDKVLDGTYSKKDNLLLGYTPEVFQELGVPSLPVVMGPGHVYSTIKTQDEARAEGRYYRQTNYHGLGADAVKNIYEKLSDPLLVIASKDVSNKFPVRSMRSVVAIVDAGTNEKSLLLPVEITVERQVGGTDMDVNVLSSIYERDVSNLIREAVAQENAGFDGLFYIGKEAAGMMADTGTIPNAAHHTSASGTILHQIPEKVNLRIENQTQTKQFADWFGDWQNDPARASKVVNEDGTPKVMYRGDSEAVYQYDRKKTSHANLYGRGFYFTDSPSHAGQYGETRPFYLDIKNPVSTTERTFTRGQMRNFIQAVSENEDYSFENYGAGATVDSVLSSVYGKSDFAMLQDVSATAIGDMVEATELFNQVNNRNYDGFILPTETVVFDSTQIKSADENVGTFDKNNPDIRYSLDDEFIDSDDTAPTTSAFSDYIQEDGTEDTLPKGGRLITSKKVSTDVAKELRRAYGSSISTELLATRVRQISESASGWSDIWYQNLTHEAGEDATAQYNEISSKVQSMAEEMADDIIDGAERRAEYDVEVADYMRNSFKNGIRIDADRASDFAEALGYENVSQLRKGTFGSIGRYVSTSKGESISSLYEAMADEFPGYVKSGIVAPEDQLAELYRAYQTVTENRTKMENPLLESGDRAQVRAEIAQRIIDDMTQRAMAYADQMYQEHLAAQQREAERLEREAARAKAQAERKARQRDTEAVNKAMEKYERVTEQAMEARLLSQTDEETILEAAHDAGFDSDAAEKRIAEARAELKAKAKERANSPEARLRAIIEDVMAKNGVGGKNVSQVRSNTFANSGILSDATLALDGMSEEAMSYDVKTEKESVKEALNRLSAQDIASQKKDMAEAAARLDNNFLKWRDKLAKQQLWTGVDLDTAMMILDQLQSDARGSGDYSDVVAWAKIVQERGTAGGQFVQSFAKYTRTAAGIMAKAAKALEEDNISQTKRDEIINNMAEFADLLSAVNDGDIESMIDLISRMNAVRGFDTSEHFKRKMRNTNDFQYLNQYALTMLANIADDYSKRSVAQKVSTFQYLRQLLNIRTMNRNLTSNAAFFAMKPQVELWSAPVDWLIGLKSKNRTVGLDLNPTHMRETKQGAWDRARKAQLETRFDVDLGNSQSKYGEGSRRTFKMAQKGIGHVVTRLFSRQEMLNGYSLNVTDEFFKGAIYQSTINGYANMVAKGQITQEEVEKFAAQDMLYYTFQDDTKVGKLLNDFHNSLNNFIGWGDNGNGGHEFGLGDLVVKYRGVPGALVTRSLEFSPAGYIKAIGAMSELAKSNWTDTQAQRNAALAIGRATTGTMWIGVFAWLAKSGLIRRKEEEDDKNVSAMESAQGLSGTQVNIDAALRGLSGGSVEWQDGDNLVDIGFLDPVSSTITMGSLIGRAWRDNGGITVGDVLTANYGLGAAVFSDLSMMDTIKDVIYAIMYNNSDGAWDTVMNCSGREKITILGREKSTNFSQTKITNSRLDGVANPQQSHKN